MTSLREIGTFIAIVLGTCAIWYPLVIIALRVFGIPVKFGFGKTMRANGELIRGLGKAKFVFIQGVLLWGWPVLTGQQIYHFVIRGTRPSAGDLIVEILGWSAAGVWFGVVMWNKSSHPTNAINRAG